VKRGNFALFIRNAKACLPEPAFDAPKQSISPPLLILSGYFPDARNHKTPDLLRNQGFCVLNMAVKERFEFITSQAL
jgi:hypothetical protein